MNKSRYQFFEATVVDFWKKSGRHELPWRKTGITAYEVWVSEVMLQQTQVSRVVEYYTRFLVRFPTVEILARASWEEFLPYYEGLGYYNRGRNMLRCAQEVVARYKGVFPKDTKSLEALPGVGPYTASAILSFAYGAPHLAWDTNLKRVVGRFFLGSKQASIDESVFEKQLRTPRKKLNAVLMDFGSALCTARPKCANCPLAKRCVYYKEKGAQEVKQATKKQPFAHQEAQAVVFLHENHKQYFSLGKRKYTPFVLSQAYNTRAGIKQWFLEKYQLRVSVRPPHKYSKMRGTSTVWVHAQVLSGTHTFTSFGKSDVQEYTSKVE